MGWSFNANSPSPYVARSGKRLKQIRADKQFKLPRTTDPLNAPVARRAPEPREPRMREGHPRGGHDQVRLRVSVTNRQLSLT